MNNRGFTLVEMMVSTSLLVIMVMLLAPLFGTVTSSTANSLGKLEGDSLARQALDRIGRDLALMPQRQDLDYSLNKKTGNDELHFFASAAGVLPSSTAADDSFSLLSLIGYRVHEGNLERMAVAQSFDNLHFLTYNVDGNPTGGLPIVKNTTSDVDYHILCKGVFRFEVGFLLKSGKFSDKPLDTEKNGTDQTAVGYRSWPPDTSDYKFAQVRVPNGLGSTVQRPLGWEDVVAIVVTLAVMDPAKSQTVTVSQLESAADKLDDAESSSTLPADLVLPATVWKKQLETANSLGIPMPLQNGVRIYQRTFYFTSL